MHIKINRDAARDLGLLPRKSSKEDHLFTSVLVFILNKFEAARGESRGVQSLFYLVFYAQFSE